MGRWVAYLLLAVAGAGDRELFADDPDFTSQGEYLGVVQTGPNAGKAGLQVVALGEGKFEAVLLRGGLPGNGYVLKSASGKFSGERDGDQVILAEQSSAPPRRIALSGSFARVEDGRGQPIGQLKKVLRKSPTLGAAPAAEANVLFGRTQSPAALKDAKLTPDGLLQAGALTADPVGDFHMHLEFRTPFEPQDRGQGRGNSGVYIQERYEVQILDSFGLAGDASECGGLYRQRPPDLNMCLPPGSWQTFDIYFTPARWNDKDEKTSPARISVFHNGIAIHDDVAITGNTGAGQPEEPTLRPIRLQHHGDAVVFRNIWLVPASGKYAAFSPRHGGGCAN
jgi:hypothetical protein